MQRALKDAADGDAPEVIGVIEIGDQNLQRAVGIAGGLWNGVDNGSEERLQIDAGLGGVGGCRSGFRDRVEHGEIQLRFVGIEVDEEIVNFVKHFLRASVRTIDLVNHDDGREFGLKSFRENIARLRQRALGGVNEQHDTVDHLEGALDLAAKVGVAGCIDDVDFSAVEVDGGILGENRDSTLALELVRVHDTLGHLLIGAKGSSLAQHAVHQRRLAVVHMGDDGDIAYRLAHRCSFSFSRVRPRRPSGR